MVVKRCLHALFALLLICICGQLLAQGAIAPIQFSPANPNSSTPVTATLQYYCPADAATNVQPNGNAITLTTYANCVGTPPPICATCTPWTLPSVSLGILPAGSHSVTWQESSVDTIRVLATMGLVVSAAPTASVSAPISPSSLLLSVASLLAAGAFALRRSRGSAR
ncbi:hypothetical protein [Rudaea sp.]|uniref:hypothetical protein n=1 Tax=Rudaea sp. TaxID=2136325 RepID=UPI002ED48659